MLHCFVILTPNQIQYGAFKRARTVKKWRHDSSSSRILCLLFLWMYRENIPTPLLPVHAFFRVFYTETLNCSELFAAIKLFGVINKSFNFV